MFEIKQLFVKTNLPLPLLISKIQCLHKWMNVVCTVFLPYHITRTRKHWFCLDEHRKSNHF